MANETWKFVQAKSKQTMKQVLGIGDEKARMKITPPLTVAPITQEDDMRWNPNAVALFSTLKGAVRPITTSSMHLHHPTRIK